MRLLIDHRLRLWVPVELVREDILDHAIWTVAFVSHPVADHHRHTFELE